jgi:predicted  nucleic acid-binding Zn-ribbon protein
MSMAEETAYEKQERLNNMRLERITLEDSRSGLEQQIERINQKIRALDKQIANLSSELRLSIFGG